MTKLTRIEEVAKLAYQYAFLIDDQDLDGWWAKEESKDRWYALARQLFPQPLDDKELGEKIASMIWALSVSYATPHRVGKAKFVATDFADQKLINKSPYYELADQILARLQPKIEEAKRGIIELIKNIPCFYAETVWPTTIEEAGKFLTDMGVSDKDKTAISGAIARLGWNNAIHTVLEVLKEGE